MKTLSATLLAAQKRGDRVPSVTAKAYSYEQGITLKAWTRLYTGSEPDGQHGIAFDGQGSMHRVRVDGADIYHQKVVNPDSGSDYSPWTAIASNASGACGIAASGSKVYIFYRTTGNVIWKYYSHDYGASWNNAQLVDWADTEGIDAVWEGTGNTVVCFAVRTDSGSNMGQVNAITLDTSTQAATSHQRDLYTAQHPITTSTWGIGATYDAVNTYYPVLVCACEEAAAINGLYRLTYENGSWTAPFDIITADDSEDAISYRYPSCHLPLSLKDSESLMAGFNEKYTGSGAYDLPLESHLVKDGAWTSGLLTEPKPYLNATSTYGFRIASTAEYYWTEYPAGIWRSPREDATETDFSQDILSLDSVLHERTPGWINLEVDNSQGQYATPPPLGSELVLSIGYLTSAGAENVEHARFWIDQERYTSHGGQSTLTIHGVDQWGLEDFWTARNIIRFNYPDYTPRTLWEIAEHLIARAGIKLWNNPGVSRSTALTGYYPRLYIRASSGGVAELRRILDRCTDGLVQYGDQVYFRELTSSDPSCYTYGTDHAIIEGQYQQAVSTTRTQVTGKLADGTQVIAQAFDWDALEKGIDHLHLRYDADLDEAAECQKRADSMLRHEGQDGAGRRISIPPNCGQQLFDVVTVNDARCGISGELYRITDIETVYQPPRRQYHQTLTLAAP